MHRPLSCVWVGLEPEVKPMWVVGLTLARASVRFSFLWWVNLPKAGP